MFEMFVIIYLQILVISSAFKMSEGQVIKVNNVSIYFACVWKIIPLLKVFKNRVRRKIHGSKNAHNIFGKVEYRITIYR
jgi:hypothetical protein